MDIKDLSVKEIIKELKKRIKVATITVEDNVYLEINKKELGGM